MTALEQYATLAVIAVLTGAAVLSLVFLSRLAERKLHARTRHSSSKAEPQQQPAWRRYHIHYYIYALLFLAFDMEMAFMYPWSVVYKEIGLTALVDMGIFLLILFLGLLYAWSQKGLKRQ